MKPTLSEIAAAAGVGVATVWRVLNGRENVAPATAERVIRTARRLGLPRALPDRWRAPLRVEAFLVGSEGPFYRRLGEGFLQAQASLGDDVIVHRTFLPETDPELLAARIEAAVGQRQGIMVYAPEHPGVLAAMERAAAAGLPVITLVTDVDCRGRIAHVGIDQHAAGRTAGFFLGALARGSGPVAIVTGRQSYRAHRQRIEGCRAALAERWPGLGPVSVVEGLDERQRTREAVLRCLDRHPGLAAIYNTASANREIGEVLAATGRAGRVVFVGHETTDSTAALLRAGTMQVSIDQNPELHALRALQIVLRYARQGEVQPEEAEIPFSIHCPENLRSSFAAPRGR